jgi:hypothetical protein
MTCPFETPDEGGTNGHSRPQALQEPQFQRSPICAAITGGLIFGQSSQLPRVPRF